MINNEMFEIPQGFEGIMAKLNKDSKLQFIQIKVKNSSFFELQEDGNLVMLKTPNKYKVNEETIEFTFSGVDFVLNKESINKVENGYNFKTDIPIHGLDEDVHIFIPDESKVIKDMKSIWGK